MNRRLIFLVLITGLLLLLYFINYFINSKSQKSLLCKAKGGCGGSPYSDADKQCSDSTQCQGRCIYSYDTNEQQYKKFALNFKAGQRFGVQGKCEANNSPFKCSAEVKNGYIYTPVACLDPEPMR